MVGAQLMQAFCAFLAIVRPCESPFAAETVKAVLEECSTSQCFPSDHEHADHAERAAWKRLLQPELHGPQQCLCTQLSGL